MNTATLRSKGLRWVRRILGALTIILVTLAAGIYIVSRMRLGQKYVRHDVALTLPMDSLSLARGEHIARLSCYGCHRDSLQGGVMFDEPGVGRIVAPNVMERVAGYSDAELAGYLRYGVKKDGTSGVVMPPPGFYHMSDADLASVIAFIRRQPRAASPQIPGTSIGPLGHMGVAMGQFRTAVHDIDTTHARIGADPAYRTTRQGEYLALMICANCHGSTLAGNPTNNAPALSGAVGYSAEQFKTLLREGRPNSDKTLTLMAEVVRSELKRLTDEEITAVYRYLQGLSTAGTPH